MDVAANQGRAGQTPGETEAVLAAVAESVSEGLLIIDANGLVLKMNQRLRDLLDAGDAPVDGRLVRDVERELAAPQRQLLRNLVTPPSDVSCSPRPDQEPWRKEIVCRLREATRLLVVATPVAPEGGRPLGRVFVVRDLATERTASQIANDLLNAVTHQLRGHLTAILGFASLLASGHMGRTSPRQATALERIRRQSVRLHGCINDMIEVARLDSGTLRLDLEDVDIVSLLGACIEEAAMRAESKRVSVTYGVSEGVPLVRVDRARIVRVLAVLLDNAVGFSPRGDTVAVQVHPAGGSVQISIRDNGPGVPPSATEHIFEKFHHTFFNGRLDRGAGLGLHLAWQVVRLHGGRMDLHAASKGCTLALRLPASSAPRGQQASAAEVALDARSRARASARVGAMGR